jgi:fused signal recognition particle receptor
MFEILKKKFKNIVEKFSKKIEEKEKTREEIEKIEEKEPEEAIQKIEKISEEFPEIKSEVEEIKKEGKKEKSAIKKVTEKILKKISEKKLSEKDLESIISGIEEDLIEADVAFEVAEKIKKDLKENLINKEVKRGKEKEVVLNYLRKSLLEILSVPKIDLEEVIKKAKSENRPALLLFFGINGVGKSLNLTKVAKWLQDKGYRPLLAAGDTYRFAADKQLELYAEKINVPVIKRQRGADSCSVIFDARKAAEAKGYDVVLGDTSGRMHTKKNLMEELAKIVRVNKPDLKILVLDSLSGSDVISQFEFFDKAVKVDAVLFSKVDVNEKGGNILSVCYNFKKPILFLGNGQKLEDLIPYDPKKFVDLLVEM